MSTENNLRSLSEPSQNALMWQSNNQQIKVYASSSKNCLSATIQDSIRGFQEFDFTHIKCGVNGTLPHQDFIQKTLDVAKDQIAVFAYPPEGKTEEIWIFVASKTVALHVKRAKEALKEIQGSNRATVEDYQKAIKAFETALKIQKTQKGNTLELESVILQINKNYFLLKIAQEIDGYLSSEQAAEFNQLIELYTDQDDFFSCLAEYFKAFEDSTLEPHLLCLAALLHEYHQEPIAAIPYYLELAVKYPDSLQCLKKAESLVKAASDPFAAPHFLERLDGRLLTRLSGKEGADPDLQRWILHKDAIRMAFEESITELKQRALPGPAPTCFICFNLEESDIAQWLERVLIPDLYRAGVKPIFCLEELGPGKELNEFQGKIRNTDQAIIICTPGLKKKCDARKEAPIGVAQEVRLAKERYNDANKWQTLFPLYLKGNRQSSCPSDFFEPILGSKFTLLEKSTEASVFSYYAIVFELFGGMRGIPREVSRRAKEKFLDKANEILKGKINLDDLKKWRDERAQKGNF